MLCTSSSSDRDLCSTTRESANEFWAVCFQDIFLIFVAVFRWVLFYHVGGFGLIYAKVSYLSKLPLKLGIPMANIECA